MEEDREKLGLIKHGRKRKESLAALCLNDLEVVQTEITNDERIELASKSESYDDAFEKTASEHCEEIKRKSQDNETKCMIQSAFVKQISPKQRNKKKTNLLRKNSTISGEEYSRRMFQEEYISFRKESRDSTVSTKTITVLRDNSCSLISIPYYLGSECSSTSENSLWTTSPTRPRLQIDLMKKVPEPRSSIKPQLQAICITLLMLTLVLIMVGIILFIVTYFT